MGSIRSILSFVSKIKMVGCVQAGIAPLRNPRIKERRRRTMDGEVLRKVAINNTHAILIALQHYNVAPEKIVPAFPTSPFLFGATGLKCFIT
jgi:hypothetical protein